MNDWKFIPRTFELEQETDWQKNVQPVMNEHSACYDLRNKTGEIIGFLVFFNHL